MALMLMLLRDILSPPLDPFTGKPMTRTWMFCVAANVAYDERRYTEDDRDRGKRDPLVMCARLWVIIAQRIHRTSGNAHMYVTVETDADGNITWHRECNYCGDTDVDALINDGVCADCHAELEA